MKLCGVSVSLLKQKSLTLHGQKDHALLIGENDARKTEETVTKYNLYISHIHEH